MTVINTVSSLVVEDGIGILSINYAPVNALSQSVREGLVQGMRKANADPAIKAVVLICEGRTFLAGADITEFGKPPRAPSLFEAQDEIEGGSPNTPSRRPACAALASWSWRTKVLSIAKVSAVSAKPAWLPISALLNPRASNNCR